jgi:acyl-CoA synthetase (NDP forming)
MGAFFSPRSVAVIGASSTKGKAGYYLFRNLLEGGYRGKIYPVNPGARRVLGCTAYASVRDIPGTVDLAFLVVSSAHVIGALRDCAVHKVQAVTIVTAGFAEVGEQGRALQMEAAEIVRSSGMRAVGPNSVGLVSASNGLMGSFVPFPAWPSGRVAIAAQTGIFTGAFADQLADSKTQRIGFSRSICLGNSIDIDEVDFLEYAERDRETDVIALHLESFKRARAFLSAANRIKRTKPILVLKTGRSEEGARAAASHSGALAAQDRVVDAALKQYGVVRAETLDDFIGTAKAFAWQPLPRGSRVGIVTLSGALGVMAVDEMSGTGLRLAEFSDATIRSIRSLLPEWQPVRNPADVWMALGAGTEKAHEQTLGAVLSDPTVDMLLCILLPIPNADFASVRNVFARLRRRHQAKPIFLILIGGKVKQRWLRELEPLRVPAYSDPRSAVRAMEAMRYYGEHRSRICTDPVLKPMNGRPN